MSHSQMPDVLRLTQRLARLLDEATAGRDDDAAIRRTAAEAARLVREAETVPSQAREELAQSLQAVADRSEPAAALLDRVGRAQCELTAERLGSGAAAGR